SPRMGSTDGNLPASLYLELRRQTLAHARLIAGPRLKKPNVGAGGLERNAEMALAAQRASRLHRLGFSSQAASTNSLLSERPATLLPSSTSNQAAQQAKIPAQTDVV